MRETSVRGRIMKLLKELEMELPPEQVVWATLAILSDYVKYDNILPYYVQVLQSNGYHVELKH